MVIVTVYMYTNDLRNEVMTIFYIKAKHKHTALINTRRCKITFIFSSVVYLFSSSLVH